MTKNEKNNPQTAEDDLLSGLSRDPQNQPEKGPAADDDLLSSLSQKTQDAQKKTEVKPASDDPLAQMFAEEAAEQKPVDLSRVFEQKNEEPESEERRLFGFIPSMRRDAGANPNTEAAPAEATQSAPAETPVPAEPPVSAPAQAPAPEPVVRTSSASAESAVSELMETLAASTGPAAADMTDQDALEFAEALLNSVELSENEIPEDDAPLTSDDEAEAAKAEVPAKPEKVAREKRTRTKKQREPAPPKEKKPVDESSRSYLIRTVAILTGICTGVALLLAVINGMTKDKIADNLEKEKQEAVLEVFSEGDAIEPYLTKNGETVYLVLKDGDVLGYCVNAVGSGYIDDIGMMVGIDAEHRIEGVKIIDISETPGTGTKVQAESFLSRFQGVDSEVVIGENFDGVSGATFSSRGVAQGVNYALSVDLDLDEAARSLNTVVYDSEARENTAQENAENGVETIDIGEAGEFEEDEPAAETVIETEAPETEPVVETEAETEPVETEPETEAPETEPEPEPQPEPEPEVVIEPVQQTQPAVTEQTQPAVTEQTQPAVTEQTQPVVTEQTQPEPETEPETEPVVEVVIEVEPEPEETEAAETEEPPSTGGGGSIIKPRR